MSEVVVLSVAGSDSSGGAGIQADLRTFEAFGVRGVTALTAVTAQGRGGVEAWEPVSPALVEAQMEAALDAGPVGAVKTGMLATAAVTETVGRVLAGNEPAFGSLIVDPVLAASGGGELLEPEALPLVRAWLLPRCALFTPNIPEAEVFLGAPIAGREEMPAAAAALGELGPAAVLLKGGHLGGATSPDVLWHDGRISWLEGDRTGPGEARGTGCALSAAVAAQLARGVPLVEACRAAKVHVAQLIAGSGLPDFGRVEQGL